MTTGREKNDFLELYQKLVQKPFNQNIDRYLSLSKTPPKNLFYCILIQIIRIYIQYMHSYCIFIHDNVQTLKTNLLLSPAPSFTLLVKPPQNTLFSLSKSGLV